MHWSFAHAHDLKKDQIPLILPTGIHFPQHHLLKRLLGWGGGVLFWVFLFCILVKNHLTIYVRVFFEDFLASCISMPVLCAVLIAVVSLKSGNMISLTLIFFKVVLNF